jgi:nucleoside-diphosphate-sugar epimerase
MTILVFGASSQIGCYALPALAARHENVVAVSRGAHASTSELTWLDGYLPRNVPHVQNVSAILCFGPLQLLAEWLGTAQLPLAPRVIAISSMSAETKRESEVPEERALSQLIRDGEQALASVCERHGCAWTILRPTLVYGIGMDKTLTPIAQRAMRWRVFPLPQGRGLRQPVHAQDLATAALAALEKPEAAGKILSIGGGERLSVGGMFARVRNSLSVATLPLPLPAWLLRLARRGITRLRGPLSRLDADLIADNSELTRVLGVVPRPFRPDSDCWRAPL